jgi:hypothetical protein
MKNCAHQYEFQKVEGWCFSYMESGEKFIEGDLWIVYRCKECDSTYSEKMTRAELESYVKENKP